MTFPIPQLLKPLQATIKPTANSSVVDIKPSKELSYKRIEWILDPGTFSVSKIRVVGGLSKLKIHSNMYTHTYNRHNNAAFQCPLTPYYIIIVESRISLGE